jgi:hypothetical protein
VVGLKRADACQWLTEVCDLFTERTVVLCGEVFDDGDEYFILSGDDVEGE